MHIVWQHFSKRTLTLIGVLVLITAGLLYLALRQEQPISQVALAPTPTSSPAHTALSLVSTTQPNSLTQMVDITVDSSTNKLTGAQINLSYDPQILSHVKITAGSYFANPSILLNTVDTNNGRISYVLAIGPTGVQASGSGTIATISYTLLPTTKTSTRLHFLPKTEVTQQGILGSVLKSMTDITLSIPHAYQTSATVSSAPSPTQSVGH